ncbi:MAG: MarR family transcriptional regulator [Akkermansia sp.]|nr:MarR family transcriptional regulator [Akkermansia sp.]
MTNKSPHLLFRQLLETLDDLRRDSIKALKEADKSSMLGLTVRQGSAISQLKLMLEEKPQGIALKDLAKRMQMTVPATSLLVETLVTKGYTQRTQDPDDRRAVRLTLTEQGLSIFENVYAHFHEEVDNRAQSLTSEELQALARIVEKMQH